jgi:Flp pilus assembly protein TadG
VRANSPRLTAHRPDRAETEEADSEAGNAIVEFVFVALLAFVPLVYLILAVAAVQHSRLAVANAARDVGRALAGGGAATGVGPPGERAAAALRIALENQALSPSDVEVRLVGAALPCDSPPIAAIQRPGAEFAVCVIRRQRLPGVPALLSGRGVTTVGRYVVHLDDYRRAENP